MNPPAIKGSEYAVQSLEAASWAFQRSPPIEEGHIKAANLGDDAETIGAFYGSIGWGILRRRGISEGWHSIIACVV